MAGVLIRGFLVLLIISIILGTLALLCYETVFYLSCGFTSNMVSHRALVIS
jgi:uncharacterized membrane protein